MTKVRNSLKHGQRLIEGSVWFRLYTLVSFEAPLWGFINFRSA